MSDVDSLSLGGDSPLKDSLNLKEESRPATPIDEVRDETDEPALGTEANPKSEKPDTVVDEEAEEPEKADEVVDEEAEEPEKATEAVEEDQTLVDEENNVKEPEQPDAVIDEETEEPETAENLTDEPKQASEEPAKNESLPSENVSNHSASRRSSVSSLANDDSNKGPVAQADDGAYVEDFDEDAKSNKSTGDPSPVADSNRKVRTPPPQAPAANASPSNPRHKKFSGDNNTAASPPKKKAVAADDSDDSDSSISSIDSSKNAEHKKRKEQARKEKIHRKSVAQERATRASRTVKVRGGIGTNGNTKDHRPGNIRVVSYIRDLSDYEKAHYREECGLECGVGPVPIRMRRGVGVDDLGVGCAPNPADGTQTGVTRIALVDQGDFAHYRFDDCLWGCNSLPEDMASPAIPDAAALFKSVAAPLVEKLLTANHDDDDGQSIVNASLLCVGAESSGKGTVLFGGVNPQPLAADFEAMRQHQHRLGIVGGRSKIRSPSEAGAPQPISYVEKNRRARAAKEAAVGGGDATAEAAAKKTAAKKAAAKSSKHQDPRPTEFEEMSGSSGVTADDGLVIRTVDALLKGCAGSERDVFISFLRLDGTRDRLYNLIGPACDNKDLAASEGPSSKSAAAADTDNYSDDDAHDDVTTSAAAAVSSSPATRKPSNGKADMDALQALALTLQTQVQCRPTTVPVLKSDPSLGNITTYSLRGIKPLKVTSVTQAKRLLFSARQRSQINIPESATQKVVNEFLELGGLSDPATTSIVTVIYLIPRHAGDGALPLQKLIIAGLSTSNNSHISSSMGQTQLAVGNSLSDAVRFGRRGFPESGYKDITHFRDSTLSRALKECVFGPQAAVTILGCLAPTTRYAMPTHNTIRFLDRIKSIEVPEEDLDGAVLEADTRIAEEAGSKPPVQPAEPLTHYRILGTICGGQGVAAATAEFENVLNVRADEKRNNRGMGGYGFNEGKGAGSAADDNDTNGRDGDVKRKSGAGGGGAFRLPGEKRDGPLWKDKYRGPVLLDHKAPTEAVGFVFGNHGHVPSAASAIGANNMEPQTARKFLYDARRVQRGETDKRQELMQKEREAFVSLARKDMKERLTYFRANPKVSLANPTTFAEYEKLEAKRKAQKAAQLALHEEKKRGGGKGHSLSTHADPKKYADDFEARARQGDNTDSDLSGGSDEENDFESSVRPKPAAKKSKKGPSDAAGPHPHAKYGFFKADYRNPTKPLGDTIPSNATYALEHSERNTEKKPRPFALPDDMKKKYAPKPLVEEEPPVPEKKVITPRQPVKKPAPPAGSKTNPSASPRTKGSNAAPKQPSPPAPSKAATANPRGGPAPEATKLDGSAPSSSSISKASSRTPSASNSKRPSESGSKAPEDSRRSSEDNDDKKSKPASESGDHEDRASNPDDSNADVEDVLVKEEPSQDEPALNEYLIPLSDLHFLNSTEGKRVADHFGHRVHLFNFRLESDVLPDGRRASLIDDKAAREIAPIRIFNAELIEDREEPRNNRAVVYRDMVRAMGKDIPEGDADPSEAPVVMFSGVMRGINVEVYRLYKELEDAEEGKKKPQFIKRIRPSETTLEIPLMISCLTGGDEATAISPELLEGGNPKLAAYIHNVFGESCSLVSTARKAYQYVLRNEDAPNPASPGDKALRWSRFRRFCTFIGSYYETLTEVCGYMRDIATAQNGGVPLPPLCEDDVDTCLERFATSSKALPSGNAMSFLNGSVSDEVVARMVAYAYQYLQISECAFKYYYEGGAEDMATTGITNRHHSKNYAIIEPGIKALKKWCADHWALDESQLRKRFAAQGKEVPVEEAVDEDGNTISRVLLHNGITVNPFFVAEWLVRKVINRLEFQEAAEEETDKRAEAAWIVRAEEVTSITDDEDVEVEETESEYEEYEEDEEEEEM